MILGMHHTAISTPDLERSIAFYRDLFGFDLTMDWSWPRGSVAMDTTHALRDTSGRVVMLEREGAKLEVFQYETPTPTPASPDRTNCDHGITHLCFEVKDIDAEYARLRDAGMKFHAPPVDHGTVKCTYGRDPDGNVIEIIEYLDGPGQG
jgi:catechol 2,3-dioxygenase-like lactoylglutathione lyase family enzyme